MSANNSTERRCKFDGCRNKHCAKGFCNSHWKQLKEGRKLAPIYSTQRKRGTPPRIEYREVPCLVTGLIGPCHEWTRGKRDGYGRVDFNKKKVSVHRYVWELANGPIPDGLVIDHQCRNKACCNVNHLRLVTQKVNATENIVNAIWEIQKTKTHCKHGHEFNKENTRIDVKGHRRCRSCEREHSEKYRLKIPSSS